MNVEEASRDAPDDKAGCVYSSSNLRFVVTAPPPYLGYLFKLLWNAIQVDFERALTAAGFHDLAPAHRVVMATIAFDGARITEMAERARITRQAMSQLVSELEDLGYVERIADPSDRRAKLVMLTDHGRAAVDVAVEALHRLEREWTRKLGRERMRELRASLEEIGATLW